MCKEINTLLISTSREQRPIIPGEVTQLGGIGLKLFHLQTGIHNFFCMQPTSRETSCRCYQFTASWMGHSKTTTHNESSPGFNKEFSIILIQDLTH